MTTSKIVSSLGVAPVTTHSWSKDGDNVAVSLNDKDVLVMRTGGGGSGTKWKVSATLDQHDLRVTGIDWAPNTNRIVTCSADRTAYVWSLQPDGVTWRHTLVLLRINRAATCVKWSPRENKFAVGSGARIISICYFASDNDWWVAKHIKKPIQSTVTTLDWHPNNCLLAAGSTGFKVRVFSAYIKDLEDKPSPTPWGSKMPFQNLMAEFSNSLHGGGWVHCVAFNHDGNKLAWIGHDSSVSVADATKGMAIFKLKTNHLPLLSLVWISPERIVAAGHGCTPLMFNVDASSGQVAFASKLEDDTKNETVTKSSARIIFQNRDKTGCSELVNTMLNTTHQNQISCVRIHTGNKARADKISTSAGDGKIVIWDLRALEQQMETLKC